MNSPLTLDEIIAACFFFTFLWLMAYFSATRKPDAGITSEFYRSFYKMSDNQIKAMHRFGAVFAAMLGTMAPLMIFVRSDTGRQIVVAAFFLALLIAPIVVFWWKPPNNSPQENRSSGANRQKNIPKIISIITLGFAIVLPVVAYLSTGSITFALGGFVMMIFVPAVYFFVSLH